MRFSSLRPVALMSAKRLAVVAVFLGGCSSGMAELQAYVAEVKSRPGPPLDPLPIMLRFDTFLYEADGLRDPFSVPKDDSSAGVGEGPRPKEHRRELLESFPLDSLDMVGTLGGTEDGKTMVALVIDPDRVVHRVTVGNYMGQNDGQVTAIGESRIDIVELVSDGAGSWLKRDAAVSLDDK